MNTLASHRLVLGSVFALGLVASACSSGGYPKKVQADSDPPNTPCEGSKACQVWGWCSEKNGQCIAANDEGCRSSQSCKQGGLCSVEGERCVAKTDSDCSDSEWCDKFGFCDAENGVCR